MKFSKLLRSRKALSPIFAVLILIAIAVIAGIVVYMFTSGTIATMTGGGTARQEKVAVEAVAVNATTGFETVTVWAKSTGGGPVNIDGAILKDSSGIVLFVDNTVADTLPANGTLIGVNASGLYASLTTGYTFTVTLTSQDGGSFVSASFKAP